MVTHEADDRRLCPHASSVSATGWSTRSTSGRIATPRRAGHDAVRPPSLLALREIRRNLLRSFLTMLGIVIGVGAVIAMVTLGKGATPGRSSRRSPPWAATCSSSCPARAPGAAAAAQLPQPFKLEDVDAIRAPGRAASPPSRRRRSRAGTVVRNAANWSTTVTGTTDDYLRRAALDAGRRPRFHARREQAGKAVCISAKRSQANLFRDQRPGRQRRAARQTSAAR